MKENTDGADVNANDVTQHVIVEDILAAAFRVANQQQNPDAGRRLMNTEIAALLPDFNRVDMVKSTYRLSDEVAVAALNWYHSKPVYATYGYNDLKQHLVLMFSCSEDRITLIRKFDSRHSKVYWTRQRRRENNIQAC